MLHSSHDEILFNLLANYNLTLNVTLDNVLKQLNRIHNGICDIKSDSFEIDGYVVEGKTVTERFDNLRKEFARLINELNTLAD